MGIFAHRYGTVIQGHDISGTELEFNQAVKDGIPCLLFFMHDEHPVRPRDVEVGPGAEKLKSLKERLSNDPTRVIGYFRSPDDLRTQVVQGLVQLRERLLKERRPSTRSAVSGKNKAEDAATNVPKPMGQVLLVNDDKAGLERLKYSLEHSDLNVQTAGTVREALDRIAASDQRLKAIVIDLFLAPGQGGRDALREYADLGPNGYALAYKIRKEINPSIPILGISGYLRDVSEGCLEWFRKHGDPPHSAGVYDWNRQWRLVRRRIFNLVGVKSQARVFIVHGHDHATRDQLREYARRLGFEPRVLGELEWRAEPGSRCSKMRPKLLIWSGSCLQAMNSPTRRNRVGTS